MDPRKEGLDMAHAVKNAVIVSEKGPDFRYKCKCDKCGTVQPSEQGGRITGSEGHTSTFYCSKCKEIRAVEIRG